MKKLLIALMLLSVTALQSQSDYDYKTGYSVGDKATDFELKNVDGSMISLKGTYPDANGYIVIFTCNHCPYAKMYEDRIIEINETYAPQGYPVIAINPNDPDIVPEDSYEKMIKRADKKNFEFPYVFDEKQDIFPEYGALKTPHVFLLDSDLTVHYIGAIDDNPRNASDVDQQYLKNAVESMKSGVSPDPAETKAVGCRIKVKS
ncbi:MAG: thioredoxin family protein [Saprospiraceae bacterium]|nr:thioredoxin family protein [Saprospiraceae bacterium]